MHLLERALELSGKRGMHSWTLRVTCDLAALMRADGRFDEADAILRRALDSLPEASDEPGRQRALAQLNQPDGEGCTPAPALEPKDEDRFPAAVSH
jgi:uncharacterized protein HemY